MRVRTQEAFVHVGQACPEPRQGDLASCHSLVIRSMAGDKLLPNESVNMLYRRLPRLDLPGQTYFLGCNLDQRRCYLEHPRLAEILIQLYVAERDRGEIALHAYVIMPDHYHVLLTLRKETSVSALVRKVHSLFAPRCREIFGPQKRIWQRRFYDHVIRDDEDLHDKWGYVHHNPVERGLVDDPTKYRWSSCAYWETGAGPVICDPAR